MAEQKQQSEGQIVQLRFPSTLGQSRHASILSFTVVKVDRSLTSREGIFGSKSTSKQVDLGTVFMYMPDIGEVKYDNSYNSDPAGMFEKLATAFTGAGGGLDGIGAGLQVAIAGALPDAASVFTNDIANPFTIAKYEGPALRQQSFDFTLAPRNETELQSIADIVHFFKSHSATEYDAGVARLQFPSQFIIEELPTKEQVMPTFLFGPAYCESVSIQSDKSGAVFASGDAPIFKLKLQFVETNILTKADIELGM